MSPDSSTKEETFRYPLSYSLLGWGGIALPFVFAFAIPVRDESDVVGVLFIFVLFLSLGGWLIHITRHHFIATDSGLACLYPSRPRVFIGWSEISRVGENSLSQKVSIYGPAGKKVMDFYSYLDNYQSLKWLVLEKAQNLDRRAPQTTLKTAPWMYGIWLVGGIVSTSVLVKAPHKEGETLAWFVFLLFTGYCWVKWFTVVLKITVEEDGIQIHYFMRSRRIRYEDIVKVHVGEERGPKGEFIQIVEVTLRSGEELRIKTIFSGGSLALREVFSVAAERARSRGVTMAMDAP